MKKADILISNKDGVYLIKVDGRATFECAPPLRNFAKELEHSSFTRICVDLKSCTGMDSTFMGILAMLGLRAKKIGADMTIYNATELGVSLLHGLGLKKLFNYANGDMDSLAAQASTVQPASQEAKQDEKVEGAKMVLEAHKTLMSVDEGNVKKFEKVVDLVQKDLDKMNGGK